MLHSFYFIHSFMCCFGAGPLFLELCLRFAARHANFASSTGFDCRAEWSIDAGSGGAVFVSVTSELAVNFTEVTFLGCTLVGNHASGYAGEHVFVSDVTL